MGDAVWLWVLIGVVGILLALVAFTKLSEFFSAEERAIRALRRRAPTPACDVKDDTLVLVEGLVRARQPLLEAPLSRRPCVAFRVYGRLLDPEDPDSVIPRSVDVAYQAVEFEIDDGSGSVLVDAREARLDLEADFHAKEPTYALRKIWTYPSGRAKPVEYREIVLPVGARVVVGGAARQSRTVAADGGAPYRDGKHEICLTAGNLPVIIGRPRRRVQ